MNFVRLLLISMVAPVIACLGISIGMAGSVGVSAFFPLPFALAGSLLLLAPVYAGLTRAGAATGTRYVTVLLTGAGGGVLVLGAFTAGRLDGLSWGGVYGLATAAAWIALHLASIWAFRPSGTGSR